MFETLLATKLAQSGLPNFYQAAIRAICSESPQDLPKTSLGQESLIDHLIENAWERAEADGVTRQAPSQLTSLNSMLAPATPSVRAGMDEIDKIRLGIDGFFLCSAPLKPLTSQESRELLKGIPPYRSIKQGYIDFTGDTGVTGLKTKFTASLLTGDWASVLGESMNKRMVRDYNAMNLQTWRPFTAVVPITDFKTQRRVRIGGYQNLPTVGQGAPYLPLTSPGDEEATYVATKRGGTETVSIELIKNDDVNAVRQIPTRMARGAAQTLHEFVFGFVNPAVNGLVYDGKALYHEDHNNAGTAALAADGVALKAARKAIRRQVELSSGKPLGLRPGFLLVPADLEDVAYKLLTPAAEKSNNVPDYLQTLGILPIVVEYWDDDENWCLTAKLEDVAGLEIGFLDGKEDPELFASDLMNAGSWFTNDVLTYKIKHIYSGAITDYRAFYGSVVAGE